MTTVSERINRARAEARKPSANGHTPPPQAEPWPAPIPFGDVGVLPAFPVASLPAWQREWIEAVAVETQTPVDLAACCLLGITGAALAKRLRVRIRGNWHEPSNLYCVSALLPGERKSAVFAAAMVPVQAHETDLLADAGPIIAEAASEHRQLEARLKAIESRVAKEDDSAKVAMMKAEAAEAAKALAAHSVPATPQLFVDDATPEKLANVLALQGGRILQASAEGTAFEIAKGRYSESANFDVYLKGHAGDPLRVGRISRTDDIVDAPALSLVLAVQPDVIHGLADQASMRGRGFLARILYSLPISTVGRREIRPQPMPQAVARRYRDCMVALWRIRPATAEDGTATEHILHLSAEADDLLATFETWLEPQLAEGSDLASLAGWANKLAGACARIALGLHMAAAVEVDQPWQTSIGAEAMAAAIRIGRDYFLPHALAAFDLMGADERVEGARRVAQWLIEFHEYHESTPPSVTRREIHQAHRKRFRTVDELDPILELLISHYYLRPPLESERPVRGRPSPTYLVNPGLLPGREKGTPRTHGTHGTQKPGSRR